MNNKTQNELPKSNILVVLLILGTLLNFGAIFIENAAYLNIFIGDEIQKIQYELRTKMFITSVIVLRSILYIVIAFWLYIKSKRQGENSLIWFLFGSFFGPIALILFYIIILVKAVRELSDKIKA